MRRSFLLSTAALAGALALGCGDQPTALAPNDGTTRWAATEQRIQAARAEIIRYEFLGFPITDPDRDITLLVGFRLSDGPECVGEGSGGRGQIVITPSDVFRLVERVRQGPIELYSRFVEDLCDLTAADLVASGEGNVTTRVWARGPEVRITITFTGLVELADGGRARLLGAANYYINDATGELRVHVDKFELKPIGG
jgi:hypothetical protein